MKRQYNRFYNDWRKKVLARDHNKCVVCGKVDNLRAHHLIPYEIEDYRYDVTNGITLCASHHTGYGHGLSPHSHGSVLFFVWMLKNRPEQLNWVLEAFEDI